MQPAHFARIFFRMICADISGGPQFCTPANAVDENAAEKAIDADMTLSVAVIDLAPACGAPFGTMAKPALPSRSSQSEGW